MFKTLTNWQCAIILALEGIESIGVGVNLLHKFKNSKYFSFLGKYNAKAMKSCWKSRNFPHNPLMQITKLNCIIWLKICKLVEMLMRVLFLAKTKLCRCLN